MHLENIGCCWDKKLKDLPKNELIMWNFKIKSCKDTGLWNRVFYEMLSCPNESLLSDKLQTRVSYAHIQALVCTLQNWLKQPSLSFMGFYVLLVFHQTHENLDFLGGRGGIHLHNHRDAENAEFLTLASHWLFPILQEAEIIFRSEPPKRQDF